MSSYTAQLFESLRKAQTPDVREAPKQVDYAFPLPSPEPTPSMWTARNSVPAVSPVRTGSLLGPIAPSSHNTGSPGTDGLPSDIDESHAIIKFQRSQITQLRGKIAAFEDQIAQTRGKDASVSSSQSKQYAEELAAMRTTIEAQTSEISKLRDERANLTRKIVEQQRKIDELKKDLDRARDPAFRLGKDTAANALASSQTLSSGAAANGSASPFRLTDAPSATPSVRRGAGLRSPPPEATSREESKDNNAEDSAGALLRELEIESKPPVTAVGDSTAIQMSSITASAEAATTNLLAKQEQIRQQEVLLQALKQQQAQNRVLSAQAQRLQHQQHHSFPTHNAFGNQPHSVSGYGAYGASPGRFGAPPPPPHQPYGAGPAPFGSPYGASSSFPPRNRAFGAGPGGYGSHGVSPYNAPSSLGPAGVGYSGRNLGVTPRRPTMGGHGGFGSPAYSTPAPYGAPPSGGFNEYGGSQEPGEYGPDGGDGMQPNLPPPNSPATMGEAIFPPPGGWTVYAHPPAGTPWPVSMAFFYPLVEVGIPFLKHGRMGRPHTRLMWLDISIPSTPVLVWQEGDVKNPERVKEKDRLPLIDIEDIKAGRVSPVLERSGKLGDANKYMSFTGKDRTLDVEWPTSEARDWFFKKFADLFQAYATAQREKLEGDDITLRVADIMDNGAVSVDPLDEGMDGPGPYAPPPPPPMMGGYRGGGSMYPPQEYGHGGMGGGGGYPPHRHGGRAHSPGRGMY